MTALLLAVVAGLLMGGGIAFYRQRKPLVLVVSLFALSLLTLWGAASLTAGQS